jgi:thymidylate synthase ThyX
MTNARILADSVNTGVGNRLTTFLLEDFPKCLLAELNTHRMLSRNAASSRAIPASKLIEQITERPFVPKWTGAAKGMVGEDISSDYDTQRNATAEWLWSRDVAIEQARRLVDLGIAKQNVNRLLEPWMTVPVVASGTEWQNFFKLRTAPDAQPEFRDFAILMHRLMSNSVPDQVSPGGWHIPLADTVESSVARCARGSYGSFTGESSEYKDLELHNRLAESGHWSPFEHQAVALPAGSTEFTANFRGWQQYRCQLSL